MNEHLTFDQLTQAVNRSPESLSPRQYKHLKTCDTCLRAYNAQLSAHNVLKTVRPHKAPAAIAKKVLDRISHLSTVKVRQKTDWLFLLSMVLLFSIASWYVFSGKASSVIKEYAPDIAEPKVIDALKDGLSAVNFQFNLPDLNMGNIYLAVGILVILIYMLIDRKITRNFKVHKT